ncbi:hypothetical protein MKK84_19150 [Methylobacterium sp. E-065]|uniref:hypothetical protein n=1 Tax=Methylobacterium sp. E-065 TaxID=2836583 RepID=UPI001FBAFDB5|nr:hypothetical protein [Methylobacterium sp. E-065]MCJ2019526.1 hypothetical protein [Methylobacterium sp. E-065]
MERAPLYIVRGVAKRGNVTYNCPSPEWAVRKYRDLQQRDWVELTITGPDGQTLTMVDLEGMSVEAAVPMANTPVYPS